MALIGDVKFTQNVIKVSVYQPAGYAEIKAGEENYWVFWPGNAGKVSTIISTIVEQLAAQGYKIISVDDSTTTLQLDNPDAPENAGVTAKYEMRDLKQPEPSKGGCFVATACYGDYDHPDVVVFRRWRDEVLMPSPSGRAFVRFYYLFSPPLAKRVQKLPRLAGTIRKFVLEPLALKMKSGSRGNSTWINRKKSQITLHEARLTSRKIAMKKPCLVWNRSRPSLQTFGLDVDQSGVGAFGSREL